MKGRLYLFLLMKRIQRGFFTFMEKTKATVAFSTSLQPATSEVELTWSSKSGIAKLLSQELHSASQHQDPWLLTVSVSINQCFISIYFLYSQQDVPLGNCFFSLQKVSKNAVSLDSKGNLYTVTYTTESLNVGLRVIPYLPL